MLSPAVLGLRAHSGWAAVVAIGGPAKAPRALYRGRMEMAEALGGRAGQPYHLAAEMELEEAREYLARTAEMAESLAGEALGKTVTDLKRRGFEAKQCGLLLAAGRPLADLAKTLASHPAIHTAEGEFYRRALRAGAERCGLAVTGIRERGLVSEGSARLGIGEEELLRAVCEMGKPLGAPWRMDEKYCALAGWMVAGRKGQSV